MMHSTQKEAFKRVRLELSRIADSLHTDSWPADALYLTLASSQDAARLHEYTLEVLNSGGSDKQAEEMLKRTLNRLRQHTARLVESV